MIFVMRFVKKNFFEPTKIYAASQWPHLQLSLAEGTRWPGLVVPDTKTVRIMEPNEGDGGFSWHVLLLEANDQHRWVPDTDLADFSAEDEGARARGLAFGRALKVALALAKLSCQERVGELIRRNRLQQLKRKPS